MYKSQTMLTLREDFGSSTRWAKKYNFTISAVNDLLNKRGYYTTMSVPNNWTAAYRILQQLILDGYSEQLKADGWDPALVDTTKIININKTKSTSEQHLQTICWDVCELGDEYTCNLFNSPTPDAGPLAILFMMEKSSKATRLACKFLTKKYTTYMFYMESADVITIWTKE